MTQAIYKNLTRGGWSLIDAKITRQGYASKGKGPSHHTGGLLMTNVVTNNPKTIASGCARILKNLNDPTSKYGREVIAYVAGDVTEGQPLVGNVHGALAHLGTLTLDLEAGQLVLINPLDGSSRPFDPSRIAPTLTLAFNETCEVYA